MGLTHLEVIGAFGATEEVLDVAMHGLQHLKGILGLLVARCLDSHEVEERPERAAEATQMRIGSRASYIVICRVDGT